MKNIKHKEMRILIRHGKNRSSRYAILQRRWAKYIEFL
jgi:hypothetical protein